MLIKRLYLRNFRVYEDELDLDLPPGLVGVYGPNGAGKSILLEAILFTLWGKARTTKDQIRSSGVGGDCVTEVEFEHEGHLYLVRRSLKGANSQVSVEAHCDGALMSTGTRDAERYVESVLGMDDAAFRASVFAEQKQLAAFSNYSPAERRRLVLQLLGITPLDAARDAARRDARQLAADHDRLRAMLPDLEVLVIEAEDAAAAADAQDVATAEERSAAAAAADRAAVAIEAFRVLDVRRQAYDTLVVEGRSARQHHERLKADLEDKRRQLADLGSLSEQLARLEKEAEGLEEDEGAVAALVAADRAGQMLDPRPPAPRPADPDTGAVDVLEHEADRLRQETAAAGARMDAASAEVGRAQRALAQSENLSGEAECPTCGQELGGSFARVQAHRRAELDAAEERMGALASEVERLRPLTEAAVAAAEAARRQAEAAGAALAEWERVESRRRDAAAGYAATWAEAEAAGAARWLAGANETGGAGSAGATRPAEPPEPALVVAGLAAARRALQAKQDARTEALTVRGRLSSRDELERAAAVAEVELAEAAQEVENLREKVKALGYRPADLEAATAARDAAVAAAEQAAAAAQRAEITSAQARERACAAAARLQDGRSQHGRLADLESDARHRARAADLLSEFRNTVVASVGPRLALQAAELFGELTDHEYERIDVDPETYQLQISDGGHLYGLDRFSGSEIDLANLALRVAISEHIHFQSGGSVGLLVLDEVFGPLDDDRKSRMLLALERLRGRFRQILVVTHDSEIKEQMPNAVEVVKLPGRRATAQVLGD